MLADYDEEFGLCDYLYNRTKYKLYDEKLVERAKKGLLLLTFFGLREYQEHSRLLFLRTFNNKFRFINGLKSFENHRLLEERKRTENTLASLDKTAIERIKAVNSLDLKLYKYAFKIFVKRLKYFKII
jgi:hypothetical protein